MSETKLIISVDDFKYREIIFEEIKDFVDKELDKEYPEILVRYEYMYDKTSSVKYDRISSIEVDADFFYGNISTTVTSWNYDYDSLVEAKEVYDYLINEENAEDIIEALKNNEIDYIEVYREGF